MSASETQSSCHHGPGFSFPHVPVSQFFILPSGITFGLAYLLALEAQMSQILVGWFIEGSPHENQPTHQWKWHVYQPGPSVFPKRTFLVERPKKHPYFLVGFRSQIPGDEIHWGNLAGAHFLKPKLDGQIVCKSNIEPGIILDGQRVFRFLWMFDFLFKFSKRRNRMDGEMVLQHCDWKKALPPKSAGLSWFSLKLSFWGLPDTLAI